MKKRLLPSLCLITVFLTGCNTAATAASPTQPIEIVASATQAPTLSEPDAVTLPAAGENTPTPFPIATSRGPELHATDPSTVNLASGNLQLVEFFRFT